MSSDRLSILGMLVRVGMVASCLVEKVAAEYLLVIEKTLSEDRVTIGMVMEEGTVTDVVVEEEDVVGEEERKLYDSDLVEKLVSLPEEGGGRKYE